MAKEQKKPTPSDHSLHPKEWELIKLIRDKYRFGKIVVITHEGLPQRIEETVRYESLDGG